MKVALILYGPPGSGKTTWIKQEARNRGCRLFQWNVRNDRSLREGREVLHAQVRSQERTFIWIEGADDLTQEAQAFLRRILDTRSPEVSCILEVRDPSRLSEPVLSRCAMHCLKYEVSYRKTLLQGKAKELGMDTAFRPDEVPKTLEDLDLYKKTGKDPVSALFYLAEQVYQGPKGREAIRRYASGASAWLQLAWLISSA